MWQPARKRVKLGPGDSVETEFSIQRALKSGKTVPVLLNKYKMCRSLCIHSVTFF